ncbi:hypothetical protein BDZ89DRAFT_1068360 [Hymenopellis radicata]|nr:hypothetical protein BDZ89DRAFT_1068360 [Hymenopellis radicata]
MLITVTHPALFVAMKAGEVNSLFRDLASHVQPSLAILEKTWRFRRDNQDVRAPLPDYGIIFGVTYDSQQVHLLAHVLLPKVHPSGPQEYVSLLVDTFEFPSVRHIFRLGALWDDVRFPFEVLRASDDLDDAVMGSCGSTPSQVSDFSREHFEHSICDVPTDDDDVNPLEDAVKPLHPMFIQYIESWRRFYHNRANRASLSSVIGSHQVVTLRID